eukprot:scaffold4721_cov52-Cyclotella_meneghiniana.AAC.5
MRPKTSFRPPYNYWPTCDGPAGERVPPIIIPPPASYFSLEEPAQFSSLRSAMRPASCLLKR